MSSLPTSTAIRKHSVLRTRAEGFGFELIVDSLDNLAKHQVFGALMQYPDTHGEVRDLRPLIEQLHGQHALACVAADILSLVVLTPPGELGPMWCWVRPSVLAYPWAMAAPCRIFRLS